MTKTKLFSLTRDDFEFQYFRVGGNGGQKVNKTSSGCRVKHAPSGATGESRQYRDQLHNKRAAWLRCVKSDAFQLWLKKAIASANMTSQQRQTLEQKLKEEMHDSNILVEVKDQNGKWIEVKPDE